MAAPRASPSSKATLLPGRRARWSRRPGIVLPAIVFVAASSPLVPRLRASKLAGAFLDGVNVASLALMAVVTAQLGRAAVVDVPTAVLGLTGAVLILRWKTNSTWLVLGGAAAGLAAYALGLHR
jgi:chromate transporter